MATLVNIKEKLQADKTAFWKAGKTLEKDTLAVVLGNIQYEEKKGKTIKVFSDDEIQAFIFTEMKNRRDVSATYAAAGVTDRAEREAAESEFLLNYLPEQLPEEAIRGIVNKAVVELGEDANLGKIMKKVMPFTKNRADGEFVRKIVQEHIS